METTPTLETLTAQLQSSIVREQRAAIEILAHMIEDGRHPEEALALLLEAAENATYLIMQNLAKQKLARFEQDEEYFHIFHPTEVVQATCKKGHTNLYRKRDIRKIQLLHRETVHENGVKKKKYTIPCKTPGCPETITLLLDCEENE